MRSANVSEDCYNIISRQILCIIISNGIFHECLLFSERDLAVLVSFICKLLSLTCSFNYYGITWYWYWSRGTAFDDMCPIIGFMKKGISQVLTTVYR